MDSRHLGQISLEGGAGGGWLDTSVQVGTATVPLRLEIDFPDRFDEDVVEKIDLAIDGLVELDTVARSTITAAANQPDSAPARLFEQRGQSGDIDNMVEQLQPSRITLLPDGGRHSPERLAIEYRLPGAGANEKIMVRFLQGIGPQLDPAPRG